MKTRKIKLSKRKKYTLHGGSLSDHIVDFADYFNILARIDRFLRIYNKEKEMCTLYRNRFKKLLTQLERCREAKKDDIVCQKIITKINNIIFTR